MLQGIWLLSADPVVTRMPACKDVVCSLVSVESGLLLMLRYMLSRVY